jgi:hypothetical protein
MTKIDIVRDHIAKFPKLSKKGRATILFEAYPGMWPSIETARLAVRTATGSAGESNRDYFKDPKKIKFFYNGFEKWSQENLNVELRPWDEPFVIPSSIRELQIISDIHSIHLDPKVMTKFLKSASSKEALLINGDLMDSESLSRHLKGHNVIEYEKEIELCHKILKGLKEEFNHVYFKHGNHDFWLERYLLSNAREVFRALGVDLNSLLRVGELGVIPIHNLKYITFGIIDILHGHEFGGWGNGKFPARGYIDKWQTFRNKYDVNILCSHVHRQDVAVSPRSKEGKYGKGWTIPAMCRKGAVFNPYSGWNNGWATISNSEVKIITV